MNRVKAIPVEYVWEMSRALSRVHTKYSLLFDMGIETGLRIGDLLKLRVLPVLDTKITVIEQKTRKRTIISFSSQMVRRIYEYVRECNLDTYDYLFFKSASNTDKPLSRCQAYRYINAAAKALDLDDISPHSMRKTFARNLYDETGSIVAVQQALNHSNIATTILYLTDDLESVQL